MTTLVGVRLRRGGVARRGVDPPAGVCESLSATLRRSSSVSLRALLRAPGEGARRWAWCLESSARERELPAEIQLADGAAWVLLED